jgi:hypothetical protein
MRSILAACFLIASTSLASAGVLVELVDGTKLTIESHWTDGDQVHLVRGGVDMIVAKARIKSIDDGVADPDVYRGSVAEQPKSDAPAEEERPLGEMSAAELEALHEEESHRLLDLQDKRFGALYGGEATPEAKKGADEAFVTQNKRSAKIWFAFQKAQKDEAGGVPTVPGVTQPQ